MNIKLIRIVTVVASVILALGTQTAVFFAIPLALECAYQFHKGYNQNS